TAVLLVDPAVVEEDALAVGIVNDLVPPLRCETPLVVGALELQRLVLDLDESVCWQFLEVRRGALRRRSENRQETKAAHGVLSLHKNLRKISRRVAESGRQ